MEAIIQDAYVYSVLIILEVINLVASILENRFQTLEIEKKNNSQIDQEEAHEYYARDTTKRDLLIREIILNGIRSFISSESDWLIGQLMWVHFSD